MLFHIDIKADRLPPGTVCLTYDDGPGVTTAAGPGPRTAELAEYLHERGIAAAFFVIGRHAERHPELLERLSRWGHVIGNHTYTHPGLANLAASGGDVVDEVARADAIIAPYAGPGPRFLRPPYGNWRELDPSAPEPRDRPRAIVAEILNRDGRFGDYVGPINWDISGEDYDFWRRGDSARACAERYLAEIRRAGRGMILMHDSSEDASMRAGNRAFEVTRLIVPILKAEGYRFVRLDAIPQVRSAIGVTAVVALRDPDGRYLGWSDQPPGCVVATARSAGEREQFGVVPAGPDRIALRASNGLFLAPQPGHPDEIVAESPTVVDALTFDRSEWEAGRIDVPAHGRFAVEDLFG